MLILEDLKSYQQQLSVWVKVVKAVRNSDKCLVVELLNLLELEKQPPHNLVGLSIDLLLKSCIKANDLEGWCRIVAGESAQLPRRLFAHLSKDFFAGQQVKSAMATLLDLLRASDKIDELIALLKVLSKFVDQMRDEIFQRELRVLCRAGAVSEAPAEEVKAIKDDLAKLAQDATDDRPASRFQKALVFFPGGMALVARIDLEEKDILLFEKHDEDLAELEKSHTAWANNLALENECATSMDQVLVKTTTK